jgi:hypothetical protein
MALMRPGNLGPRTRMLMHLCRATGWSFLPLITTKCQKMPQRHDRISLTTEAEETTTTLHRERLGAIASDC